VRNQELRNDEKSEELRLLRELCLRKAGTIFPDGTHG
jgi:hypothetical protein